MSSSTVDDWKGPMLDDARYIPLLVVGAISCLLSICGSSCIAYMASKDLRTKVMQRLLFCLSISDWICSFSLLMMPYLIPSYLGVPGAIGTHATCTTAGFFLVIGGEMTCCYNAALSVYFYLVVVRGWKEHDFSNRPHLECLVHFVALVPTIAIEIAAAITKTINPTPIIYNVCIYAVFPWGCMELEELECTRSSDKIFKILMTVSGPIYIIFTLVGLTSASLVFCKVRKTLLKSKRYQFQGSRCDEEGQHLSAGRESTMISRGSAANGRRMGSGDSITPRSSTVTEITAATAASSTATDPHDSKIQQVGIQAVLYALAYLQTFFWPFMTLILSNTLNDAESALKKTEPGFYAMWVLFWVSFPLQGFFNFFVYTRVKAKRWRQAEPNKSFLWIYKQVVAGAIPPPSSRKSGSRNSRSRNFKQGEAQLNVQPEEEQQLDAEPHEEVEWRVA